MLITLWLYQSFYNIKQPVYGVKWGKTQLEYKRNLKNIEHTGIFLIKFINFYLKSDNFKQILQIYSMLSSPIL